MPLPHDARPDDASAARAAGGGQGAPGAPGAPNALWQVVHVHPAAPLQPAEGAPCNGCGLCCLAEPCPLGMLVSRRRSGPCAALRWREAEVEVEVEVEVEQAAVGWSENGGPEGEGASPRASASPGRYVCGMVADPGEVTGWRSAWAVGLMRALARRWIAAGIGCDAPPLRPPPREDGNGKGAGKLL